MSLTEAQIDIACALFTDIDHPRIHKHVFNPDMSLNVLKGTIKHHAPKGNQWPTIKDTILRYRWVDYYKKTQTEISNRKRSNILVFDVGTDGETMTNVSWQVCTYTFETLVTKPTIRTVTDAEFDDMFEQLVGDLESCAGITSYNLNHDLGQLILSAYTHRNANVLWQLIRTDIRYDCAMRRLNTDTWGTLSDVYMHVLGQHAVNAHQTHCDVEYLRQILQTVYCNWNSQLQASGIEAVVPIVVSSADLENTEYESLNAQQQKVVQTIPEISTLLERYIKLENTNLRLKNQYIELCANAQRKIQTSIDQLIKENEDRVLKNALLTRFLDESTPIQTIVQAIC
jgi:hypothetical protein